MNKRIKKKMSTREQAEFIKKICISKELQEDSIAHKIKNYFELDTLQQKMLFKWDSENKELLISRRCIMYLLTLCNDAEQFRNYKMKIVDDIEPI